MLDEMKTPSPVPVDKSKRIIIVEDDRDFRESLVESLLLAGFDVTGVESALEFYQNIATHDYLLVILDLGLPDQNGFVLAEYIRNNTNMRIIVLTAQSSLDTRINAYQSGADMYLLKPVDFSELQASIYSILGRLDEKQPKRFERKVVEPSAKQKEGYWTLVRSDMTLSTPGNDTIKLSSKEFDLIEMLASFSNTVISRQDLLKALDYEDNKLGNRSLDTLVHRLRQKSGEHCRMPIKTVHGSGYSFSTKIIIV